MNIWDQTADGVQHEIYRQWDYDGKTSWRIKTVWDYGSDNVFHLIGREDDVFVGGRSDFKTDWRLIKGNSDGSGTKLQITLADSQADYMWITTNSINLTNYKHLIWDMDNPNGAGAPTVRLCPYYIGNVWDSDKSECLWAGSLRGTNVWDIGNVKGFYCLGFRFYGQGRTTGPVTFNNIFLS